MCDMRQSAFVLRQFQGISYYSCRALEDLAGLRHGFSTRLGGEPLNLGYTPWDSGPRVDNNRRRFLSALQLHGADLITLHQVHSSRVHIIEDIPGEWNQPEGDALITRIEGIALGVQTADCLPVLIADPVKKVIAAVHSGWRGTLDRLAAKTIQTMRSAFGCDPAELVVALGPGIRACCYEVGSEVAEIFDREYPGCRLAHPRAGYQGKYLLDLLGALEAQLRDAGIRPENFFDLGACTGCNREEFYSYRVEGARAGRMMAVIGIVSHGRPVSGQTYNRGSALRKGGSG